MSLLFILSSYFENWASIIPVLLIIYVANFYYNYFTRPNPLPGPIPIPILGTVHIIGINPYLWYINNIEKAGTIWEFYIGHQRQLVVNHAKHLEKIYKPTPKFFERMELPSLEKFGVLKGLIFNNNYSAWHRNRKFVAPVLASPKFLRGFVISIQKLFKESENRWKPVIKNGIEFDFSVWIKCFTTDITIHHVTKQPSYSLASFDTNNEIVQSEQVRKSLNFTNAVIGFITTATYLLFIPSFVNKYIPGFRSFKEKCDRSVKYMNDTIIDIIEKRKKELEEGAEIEPDLLDHLLIAHTPRDPDYKEYDQIVPMKAYEIKAILWDILMAGVDTTGNTFSFLVYNVAKNPKILAKIHKEIEQVFGLDPNNEFTLEKLENCRYIEALVKESLRHITIAPLTLKVLEGEENVAGYNWPNGTRFWIDHQTILNNPDYWNDPEIFNPDRFLSKEYGGTFEFSNMQKNAYSPFGGGIRICPGKFMAINEIKALTVLFYRKYNVELVKNNEKIKYQFYGVNQVYDLQVRISLKDISSFP
ncbi:670_t:CDS:2 [Dentiscutata erythropus]|uniref:670_t:CDS:1 n=1 Tax=Dentiscutata erythropus TaxID=1348616 RepID=A0A9N9B0L1_9GLOM|nr:670_t:CDS:2 [Dentiscutata erythropus]